MFVSTSAMLLPEAQSEASRSGLPLPELTIKLKFGLWARRAPRGQLADGDVEHELPGQGIPTQAHTPITAFLSFSRTGCFEFSPGTKGRKSTRS